LKKIRITAVSYLNTKPLLYGLLKSDLAQRIDLQLNIPSVCAQQLLTGEAELGLVPVAVLPELRQPRIISDYCIGTVGAVKTVAIYSHVPIEKVETLYLDYHSRTSVALSKILMREYWKLSPAFLRASEGYINDIQGTTAGLVIGDRTIGLEKRFPYVYDLGDIWMKHTGLPFVFAAWVSTKPLPDAFIKAFNAALKSGLDAIPELMFLLPTPVPDFDLEAYFTNYISYHLDHDKRKALSSFLSKMSVPVQASLAASLSGS
jgi:chorismate dehydratase